MTHLHLAADWLEGLFGINPPKVSVHYYPSTSHVTVAFDRADLTSEQYRKVGAACDARPLRQRHTATADASGASRLPDGVLDVTVWGAFHNPAALRLDPDGVAAPAPA